MPENEPKDKPGMPKGVNTYMKYSAAGFQMLAVIGIFTFIGYRIDRSAHHTTQWVTAVMALTGVFIALFIVIRSLKE